MRNRVPVTEAIQMWPPKVILHPTDFSDCSQRAFDLACDIARQNNATVVITHAHFPTAIAFGEAPIPLETEPSADALEQLNQFHAKQPITLKRRLQRGTAVEWCILEAARDTRAELIVMGTHGRSGVKRAALGSVAEKVVRSANCPVLLVHPVNDPRRNISTSSRDLVASTSV